MNIRLSRTVRLQYLRRIASVGKIDRNRTIYLAFLQHIADTPNASYRTVNTQLLNVSPENQRGKSIVDLLVHDGLAVRGASSLELTEPGRAALKSGRMMEPHADDYLFTVLHDPLLPHAFYGYMLYRMAEKEGGYRQYRYLSGDTVPWLRRPAYPSYGDADSVVAGCEPREYRMLSDDSEILYLYAVCERGPEPEDSGETCVVSLSVEGTPKIRIIGKNQVAVPASFTADELADALDVSSYGIFFINGEPVICREFADMSPEEKAEGTVSVTLGEVSAGRFGTFSSGELSNIRIVVADQVSLQQWAQFRLFSAIRSYVTRDEYETACRNAAAWAVSHSAGPADETRVLSALPSYDTVISSLESGTEIPGFSEAVSVNPGIFWYLLAPRYLTVRAAGGGI